VPSNTVKRVGVIQQCLPPSDTTQTDARVQVELLPIAGCSGCERQRKAGFGSGHCGIDLFGLADKKNHTVLTIPLSQHQAATLPPGHRVEVHIPAPNGQWLAIALQVYGLPTAGLIAGAAIGSMVNELASVALSLLCGWAALYIGRKSAQAPLCFAQLSESKLGAARIVSQTN